MVPVIAFIGAGKMASALIGGLVKGGHSPEKIWVSCPTKARLEELQNRFGICAAENNTAAVLQADVLLLAVKPHQIYDVLAELRPAIFTRQPLVISVAASVSETAISTVLEQRVGVVRAMPNTPALIGRGMTALYAKQSILDLHYHQTENIFQAVGTTLWLEDEAQMNAVTALSGSGPAYFFTLMEALEKAGIALGLSSETTRHLIVQTAIGAVSMAVENVQNFQTLREQVTSPNGGTASAIHVLESQGFDRLMVEAVAAAKTRFDVMSADVEKYQKILRDNKC